MASRARSGVHFPLAVFVLAAARRCRRALLATPSIERDRRPGILRAHTTQKTASLGPPPATQADEPSDDQVNDVLERYVAELQRLFAAHAGSCLPPEVAAKGLKIVRL